MGLHIEIGFLPWCSISRGGFYPPAFATHTPSSIQFGLTAEPPVGTGTIFEKLVNNEVRSSQGLDIYSSYIFPYHTDCKEL